MRIGIDLSIYRDRQGTEMFAENLCRQFVPLALGRGWDVYIFLPRNVFPGLERLPVSPHVHLHYFDVVARGWQSVIRQQVLLPVLCLRYRVQVLYSVSPFFAFFALCKKVVTIHDCAYARFPEFRSFVSSVYIRLSIWAAKVLRVQVCTVSDFSKSELMRVYAFSPRRLAVLSEGAPLLPVVTPLQQVEIRKRLTVSSRYVLYVGITRPRKNLIRLLEAFARTVESCPDLHLVLAGSIDTSFIDMQSHIVRLQLQDRVLQVGRVTEAEKVALLGGAVALVYPSLYEGFGLPVLEAQALGVPVLTAQSTSLPEVAGEGALFCDPESVVDIAEKIIVMAKNDTLREQLAAAGKRNTNRFSWTASAEALVGVVSTI